MTRIISGNNLLIILIFLFIQISIAYGGEDFTGLTWSNFQGILAQEIRVLQSRTSSNSPGAGGSIVFRVNDVNDTNYPNPFNIGDKRIARLTADGTLGDYSDAAALMFYSQIPQAGMQVGVGPGTSDPNQVQSPHVAALRVQRVNGINEEGMVWMSTKEGPYKFAIIKTGTGLIRPLEYCDEWECDDPL